MAEKTQFGKIRQLIVGVDPKDAFVFVVGGKPIVTPKGTIQVSSIIRDENSFYFFGSITYLVYIRKDEAKEEILWKSFTDLPVMVEYEI